MQRRKSGFTLMELLIVIAIIVVLVAIVIPVFSGNLEKARETTDAANIRAAIAEANQAMQMNEVNTAKIVEITQTELGWKYVDEIGGSKCVKAEENNPGSGKKAFITKAVKNDRAKQANKQYYVCVYTDGTVRTCEGLPGSVIGNTNGSWYDVDGNLITMSNRGK